MIRRPVEPSKRDEGISEAGVALVWSSLGICIVAMGLSPEPSRRVGCRRLFSKHSCVPNGGYDTDCGRACQELGEQVCSLTWRPENTSRGAEPSSRPRLGSG